MMVVVPFKPVEEEPCIWVCNCGCVTFRHYVDGRIECASCEEFAIGPTGEWLRELPDPPSTVPVNDATSHVETRYQSGESRKALELMLRRAIKADETHRTIAIVTILENGRVSTWGGVTTEKEARWLRKQLKTAHRLLTEFVKPNGSD